MAGPSSRRRAAQPPVAVDLDRELHCIAEMNIDALRVLWRERRGSEPPEALSKDLIARALAHWLQEERLGGLEPHTRKLLVAVSKNGSTPARHLKVGCVIVREHDGTVHEVMVVPGGFCWQGQIYSSLSTIALKITGTSWNGPRFFGLRGGGEVASPPVASEEPEPPNMPRSASGGSMRAVARLKTATFQGTSQIRSSTPMQAPIGRSRSRGSVTSSGARRP